MNSSNHLLIELKKIKKIINSSKTSSANSIISKLEEFKEKNSLKNPNNILLKNSLNYILHLDQDIEGNFKKSMLNRLDEAKDHLSKSTHTICGFGSKKIKNGMNIFVYDINEIMLNLISYTKEKNKKFNLISTESRPHFEGRYLAKYLYKLNLPFTMYLDCAARLAIKDSDIILIGADNIDLNGTCYSKIGSEMFAEIARNQGVPVYICADSWQLNPGNFSFHDVSFPQESIWKSLPKNTSVNTHIYEKINPGLITGIISDLGIYNPYMFVQQAVRNNSWMFI